MPIAIAVMLSAIALIVTLLVSGLTGLSTADYARQAANSASSSFFVTGSVPSSVVVLGRTISTANLNVQNSSKAAELNYRRIELKKAVIEQAVVNTCLTLQAKCNVDDTTKLWAFMPNAGGQISTDILGGTTAATLNCGTATISDYANYGRYLFKTAIAASDLSAETIGGVNYNPFYSKPASGTGCGYQDLVEFK